MKSRAILLILPPLLCGTVYFIRAGEHASLRSQLAGAGSPTPPAVTRKGSTQENRDHAAEVRERLCRLLAAGGDMGPEESLLLLKLADPPDAALLLALAKTAASMPLEAEKRRHLYDLLGALVNPLPDHEATPVLLALSSGPQSLRSDFKQRVKSWSKASPGVLADWLEKCAADGSLRALSTSDQEELAGMIAPLRLMADPVTNLDRIRAADPSMHNALLREGLRHARTPGERRSLAARALTLPRPCAVAESLAAMVKDDGMESTAAWLIKLPGMDPAARFSALATLSTGIPGHGDIAKNAAGIFSRLPADQQGEFAAVLAGDWADKDHEAVARWINSSPDAPWLDRAREGFARRIALIGETADALIWASAIGDPAQRASVAQSLFNAWLQRDPDAARTFLTSPECPEDLAVSLAADSPNR